MVSLIPGLSIVKTSQAQVEDGKKTISLDAQMLLLNTSLDFRTCRKDYPFHYQNVVILQPGTSMSVSERF